MLATERTATGRFPPGHSGNPVGRPPGSRSKCTLAVEDALAARVLEAFAEVLRSPAGHAPAQRAAAGRQLREPAETCKSSELEGGAGEEGGEAFDLVPPPRKMPDPPPPAAAAAARQPREPAGTCKSSELKAGAGEESAEALDLVPPPPATPDSGPPAAAEAGHQPREAAETCKSSQSEAGADDENADALDLVPPPPATPDPAPPAADEAGHQRHLSIVEPPTMSFGRGRRDHRAAAERPGSLGRNSC
jgi:hypothetical protein